jgi:hypothetical protein
MSKHPKTIYIVGGQKGGVGRPQLAKPYANTESITPNKVTSP